MRKLGPILAAGIAFSAAYGCEDRPETHVEQNATPEVSPYSPAPTETSSATMWMHPCEQVGADVQHAVERALREQGADGAYLQALDEGARAQAECFDTREVREDCQEAGKKANQEITEAVYEITSNPGQIGLSQGIATEEECLAGCGLPPKDEETFANR